MARINYTALSKAIRDILAELPDVRRADATVEMNSTFTDLVNRPGIIVYPARRTATTLQDIAAGTRQRYRVTWEVWVAAFSADGFADAAEVRDELLGHVEIGLINHRDLNGMLPQKGLVLEGGEFRGGFQEASNGFVAEGSVILSAEISATT